MKKTLIHSLTFPPDTISTGMIVSKIAKEMNNTQCNIEILASSPQYNLKNSEEFSKVNSKILTISLEGIPVNYVISKPREFSNTARFFQWVSFNYHSIKFIYKNKNEYDNILIFSYPPTMNLVCIFTSKILKINTIYSLWELYPEIAEKIEEAPNLILRKLFKLLDNLALKSVQKVVVNSDELKKYLITSRKISENKINTILHFSPHNQSSDLPDLSSKKLFYAGNIGKPQNLQSFIEYFLSKFPKEWSFDIFGAGEESKNIYSQNYQNIIFNSYIEREQLDKATSQIPFALVSLDYEITMEGFPGKTFDYLNMNKILINFSNPESAVSKLITKFDLGFNIDKNNDQTFKKFIKDIESIELLEQKINNIQNYVKNYSNKEVVGKLYLSLISTSS
jgi:hypothetical protein